MGFDLRFSGIQSIGLDQLSHYQAHTHTAFGLRTEDFVGDRRLVGIFDTALFEIGAGALFQTLHFVLHHGIGQIELGFFNQGIHGSLLIAALQTKFDFAFKVLANVCAQAFNRCVGNAQ